MAAGPKTQRRQQHGEESRQRILDATVAIAAERGYEGTSISLVSKRSGLPASSIYWHFRDKDHLLAAVIERSYQLWRDRLSRAWVHTPDASNVSAASDVPDAAGRSAYLCAMVQGIAGSLLDQPEFLRLGLMLTLERRPVEAKARELFVQIRAEVQELVYAEFRGVMGDLPDDRRDPLARRLATYALAAADGLFIAYQLNPETFDLIGEFELLGTAIDATLDRWTRELP